MKKTFILLSSALLLSSAASLASPQNSDTIPIKQHDPMFNMGIMLENMSRNFFDAPGFNPPAIMHIGNSAPQVDVMENNEDIIVKIDLPGIDKEKLKLEVFQNYVSLKYSEENKKEQKDETYHMMERSYGNFQRIIPIPDDGDIQKADSNYKDGVLTITIPKSEDKKPKSKVLEI